MAGGANALAWSSLVARRNRTEIRIMMVLNGVAMMLLLEEAKCVFVVVALLLEVVATKNCPKFRG